MLLLVCIIAACIALQFTSGITQFIAMNKDATRFSTSVQWLAQKIGIAPALITTRVLILVFAGLVYLFLRNSFFWVVVGICVYYLYSTGRQAYILKKIKETIARKL